MKKNELLQSVKVMILGLVLSLGVSYIFAGIGGNTEELLPPKNNVPGPLNEGTSDQIKNGGLSVNALLVAGDSFFNGLVTLSNFIGDGNQPLCVDNSGNITTVCPEVTPTDCLPPNTCIPPVVITTPNVATLTVTDIHTNYALGGGNVTSSGEASVIEKGIVWSTSANPTVALSTKTSNGGGLGSFSDTMAGLTINITYHVRAYATNSAGTTYYGNDITFTTLNKFLLKVRGSSTNSLSYGFPNFGSGNISISPNPESGIIRRYDNTIASFPPTSTSLTLAVPSGSGNTTTGYYFYPAGTIVTLVATPTDNSVTSNNSALSGWSFGSCDSGSISPATCVLTVSGSRQATVGFYKP